MSLLAAVGSGLAIAAEGVPGTSLVASMFAALISGTALYLTWEQRPSNQWMAVVGLAAGLAPLVLLMAFLTLLNIVLF